MREIINGMLQAQATTLKTWQDHFREVCEEHGLEVETMPGGTVSIHNPTGQLIDVEGLCKEANQRAYRGNAFDISKPASMDDEFAKVREGEAKDKAKRRADLMEVLVASRERSILRNDFLAALSFEVARITIEKDLI